MGETRQVFCVFLPTKALSLMCDRYYFYYLLIYLLYKSFEDFMAAIRLWLLESDFN
jgi:hypothetical protein